MLHTYYRIWVDAITTEQNKKGDEGNWKAYTIIPISLLMGVNLLTLIFLIRLLISRSIPVIIPVSIFHYRAIDTFIAGALTFFIPFLIVNYLLVFYNRNYINLLKIYNASHGKLYRSYFLWSIGVIVIPLLLKLVF